MLTVFQKKNKQKGFTLMELMVVVGIIAILALIAIPVFQSAQATSRGSKIAADLRSIDSACAVAVANGITPTAGAAGNLVSNSENNAAGSTAVAAWPDPPAAGMDVRYPGATATKQTAGTAYTIGNGTGIYRAYYGTYLVETLPKS